MNNPYFADTMVYLAMTDQNKALSFFQKEAPVQMQSTVPLDKMEFSTGAEIMMRSLMKSGRKTVRISLPGSQPWQREDDCYETEMLAEYFGKEAREISARFDDRNGNSHSMEEYDMFLSAAKNCI